MDGILALTSRRRKYKIASCPDPDPGRFEVHPLRPQPDPKAWKKGADSWKKRVFDPVAQCS